MQIVLHREAPQSAAFRSLFLRPTPERPCQNRGVGLRLQVLASPSGGSEAHWLWRVTDLTSCQRPTNTQKPHVPEEAVFQCPGTLIAFLTLRENSDLGTTSPHLLPLPALWEISQKPFGKARAPEQTPLSLPRSGIELDFHQTLHHAN